jgi:hypothetical protein
VLLRIMACFLPVDRYDRGGRGDYGRGSDRGGYGMAPLVLCSAGLSLDRGV